MSMNERTGERDLSFNVWHRPRSMRRFLEERYASLIGMIDIDCCEYCGRCNEPLALIELQQSSNQPKPMAVTSRLADRAQIPSYSVSYRTDQTVIDETTGARDVVALRWQQRTPIVSAVVDMTPADYVEFLVSLRVEHKPGCAYWRSNNGLIDAADLNVTDEQWEQVVQTIASAPFDPPSWMPADLHEKWDRYATELAVAHANPRTPKEVAA